MSTAPQQQQQQEHHPFIKESIEPTTTVFSSTPEPSRRYVQWKEDDVGLLLADLEEPGHYSKWKENKSGFSKRVAEQVFKNGMYHEAVKFKVRWLESRFKLWNQQLTSAEQDESVVKTIREKMMKEFPYYDRCKPIFFQTANSNTAIAMDSPAAVQQQHQQQMLHLAPGVVTVEKDRGEEQECKSVLKPEMIHMANEPSSPTLIQQQHEQQQQQRSPFTDNSNHKRHLDNNATSISSFSVIKKRAITTNNRYSCKPTAVPPNDNFSASIDNNQSSSNSIYRINNNDDIITEERKIKMMELELELKKMDHQERMQEMKLEQLRLEIELQKLKRGTPPIMTSSSSS